MRRLIIIGVYGNTYTAPKPKKAYPNSDRFEEDGRRIYSSYAAAQGKKRGKRRNLPLAVGGALALALVLALLFWLIGSS